MPGRLPARPLLLAFALFLAGAYALNEIRAHNASYNATDLMLPDGTPARLVLPGPNPRAWGTTLAEGIPRPPLVILTHGIIADKEIMSGLAHAMARHGVAVLTMDWVGHAENANPFSGELLQPQLEYVIDYMRTHFAHVVDVERIGLMGHSMGGGATAEFTSYHPDTDVSVIISAHRVGPGTVPPRNVLYIYAEYDLPGIVTGVPEAIAQLTGVPDPDHDVTYGRFEEGTARRMTVVPGVEHLGIVSTAFAAREIVHWLGEVWPLGPDDTFDDPRLKWIPVAGLAALLLTCVVVRLLVPWLPVLDVQPFDLWPVRLGVLVVVQFLAVLALSLGDAFGFVGAWGGDYLAGFFFVAGLLLVGYTTATGAADWKLFWPDWRATLGFAFVLALIAYVLFGSASTGAWVRFTLAKHRLPLFVWQAVPTALFCIAQDALTKKGRLPAAVLMSVGGTLALVVVFLIALSQQLASFALMLVMPVLVPLILIFEVPSLVIYAYTRNYFLSGLYRGLALAALGACGWPLYS